MNMQELKITIAVIESCERNINVYESFRGSELVIKPNKSEKNPIYISGKKANEILDLLKKEEEDFMKPHREKLKKVINL